MKTSIIIKIVNESFDNGITTEEIKLPFANGEYKTNLYCIKKFIIDSDILRVKTTDNEYKLNYVKEKEFKHLYYGDNNNFSIYISFEVCLKEKYQEISKLNLDDLIIDEVNEIYNRFNKYDKNIIHLLNLKKMINGIELDIDKSLKLYDSDYYKEAIKRCACALFQINYILGQNEENINITNSINILLYFMEMALISQKEIISNDLEKYVYELKQKVIYKVNNLLEKNSERLQQCKKNNFKDLNGEICIYLYDNKNKVNIFGEVELLDFDLTYKPQFKLNNILSNNDFQYATIEFKSLFMLYENARNEIDYLFDSNLTEQENIERLESMSFNEDNSDCRYVELNDNMTREERDTYAYRNYAIEKGLINKPNIKSLVKDTINFYGILQKAVQSIMF